jgi:hypothetical protein
MLMILWSSSFHETQGGRLVACLPTPRVVSRFRSDDKEKRKKVLAAFGCVAR